MYEEQNNRVTQVRIVRFERYTFNYSLNLLILTILLLKFIKFIFTKCDMCAFCSRVLYGRKYKITYIMIDKWTILF